MDAVYFAILAALYVASRALVWALDILSRPS